MPLLPRKAPIISQQLMFQPTKLKGNRMSTNDAYLAIFLGSKTSLKMMARNSLPETERQVKEREEIAASKAWVEKHQGAIVAMGGPLGKTKKITQHGIEDTFQLSHSRPMGP